MPPKEQPPSQERDAILAIGGHVIETEHLHLWGFPIHLQEAYNPPIVLTHQRKDPDTWFVWWMEGDISYVWAAIPYPLPFIIFARDNRLKAYTFEALSRKLSHENQRTNERRRRQTTRPI